MTEVDEIQDVTEHTDIAHHSILRAERRGNNTLILRKLPCKQRRVDGEYATLQLEHRWHSSATAPICNVLGNDYTLWVEGELKIDEPLFDQVDLF